MIKFIPKLLLLTITQCWCMLAIWTQKTTAPETYTIASSEFIIHLQSQYLIYQLVSSFFFNRNGKMKGEMKVEMTDRGTCSNSYKNCQVTLSIKNEKVFKTTETNILWKQKLTRQMRSGIRLTLYDKKVNSWE